MVAGRRGPSINCLSQSDRRGIYPPPLGLIAQLVEVVAGAVDVVAVEDGVAYPVVEVEAG